MLLTKNVKVKWTNSNKEHYQKCGYNFTKIGDEFDCHIKDVINTSNRKLKIIMKCNNPNCNNVKTISYATYIDRLRDNDLYLCTNCFQDGHRIEDFLEIPENKICKICGEKSYKDDLCLKHYTQIKNIDKILEPLEHPCEVCGSECNIQFHTKSNLYLCRKHRLQYDRNGYFQKRTIYDPNEIILYEDYAEMLLYDLVGNEIASTFIDLDDVAKVKKYKWHLSDTGYVITCIDGINLRLHKYIIGDYENYKAHDYDNMTDHIDRNKLNNRKDNLRKVNDSENKQNRDLISTNKSGRTGLQYIKEKNKPWRINLRHNETKISRNFSTREEAEYVLDLYELYYKPFCPTYEVLKEKYKYIYDDLLKNGVEKYIYS